MTTKQRDDRDYYLRRACEERQRAEQCEAIAVARAHATMAEEYARRAEGKAATVQMAHP